MTDTLHDLAAPYVLEALDESERLRFEAHLETCPSCRDDVAALGIGASALAEGSRIEPPTTLRSSVLSAIEDVPQERFAAPTREPRGLRDRLTSWRIGFSWRIGAAAVAASVLVVATVVTLSMSSGLQPSDVVGAPDAVAVTLPATDAYGAGEVAATVAFSPDQRAAVASFDGLAAAPGGTTYQLWVIDGTGPTPAGLFLPGADGSAVVLLGAPVEPGVTIGVTIEPEGGSPAPTGDVLFAATV